MTDKIAENFLKFHAENPKVYRYFNTYALEMLHSGTSRGSAKRIFERMRWERDFGVLESTPRLNNNYTAMYARLWEEKHPDYKGFFAKRKRRANTVDSTEFDEPET